MIELSGEEDCIRCQREGLLRRVYSGQHEASWNELASLKFRLEKHIHCFACPKMILSCGHCGEHILQEIYLYRQHGQECKNHYFRCSQCYKKGIPFSKREEHSKSSTHALFQRTTEILLLSLYCQGLIEQIWTSRFVSSPHTTGSFL